MTPSARSANLIAGDGAKNGLPAPNKEPATDQKHDLTGKAPYRFESGSLQQRVGRTFQATRGVGKLALEKVTPGGEFKAMFRRLIQIRQTYDPLIRPDTRFEWLHYPQDGWFAFKRKWNASVLIVAGNWSGDDMMSYGVPTNGETGTWMQIFNSDGQEFGGDGVGNFQNSPNSNGGWITINIPKNGIVVMNRTAI